MPRNPKFTFAVIADTHVNQHEDHSSSVYHSSRLANARTRHVIEEINRLSPAFVIHLGDLVNPVPNQHTYTEAAEQFLSLASALHPPLHLVAGNHDVGDKPLEWMPAPTVTDDYIALYEGFFGSHYYSFEFDDCHFAIINAQILNSGLDCEGRQRDWLEADLNQSADKRVFVCTHYPPYVASPDEPSSYDNIDEPGRSWLLDLLEKHKVEALFAGHVHNFFYDRYAGTDCYVLPSTAFVRHEYAELSRVSPGPENGRNDGPKLGYFVVRVYSDGHVAEMVRTYGETRAPATPSHENINFVSAVHSRESDNATIGVDLRHPWVETIEISPNGASDEFARKPARNDYPLLAIWEMGVRRMRVPVQDMVRLETRHRMELLNELGHVFTVYCYGAPNRALAELLGKHHRLVDTLEIITPWRRIHETIAELKVLKHATDLPIYISPVQTEDDVRFEGGKFNLLVSHGFSLAEKDRLRELWGQLRPLAMVDGLVFRIDRDGSAWSQIQAVDAFASELDTRTMSYVRTSSSRPAEEFVDDLDNSNRVAQAVISGLGAERTDVILDALIDSDRGHYVRHGLIDRRYNPRMGSRVVRNLLGAFNSGELRLCTRELDSIEGGRLGVFRRSTDYLYLVLPEPLVASFSVPIKTGLPPPSGSIQRIDLATGVISSFECHTGSDPQTTVSLEPSIETPTVFVVAANGETGRRTALRQR
jgi:3',5'-cyclic AMP phosphodiesterase CpdA